MPSKDTDERYTPMKYIKSVRKVLGNIDLDPFSSVLGNSRVQAIKFFTKEEDGFGQTWKGRIFTNPPYSIGNLPAAVERFCYYYSQNLIEAIVLLPNWTERKWFQVILEMKIPICLTNHRICFLTYNPISKKFVINKNPEGGSVFAYFGKSNKIGFYTEFKKYGQIINPFPDYVCDCPDYED